MEKLKAQAKNENNGSNVTDMIFLPRNPNEHGKFTITMGNCIGFVVFCFLLLTTFITLELLYV